MVLADVVVVVVGGSLTSKAFTEYRWFGVGGDVWGWPEASTKQRVAASRLMAEEGRQARGRRLAGVLFRRASELGPG